MENTLLDKAKSLIIDFCVAEYNTDPDFSDLSDISIAYTTVGDQEAPLQVSIDLLNLKVQRYIYDELLDGRQYSSLEEMIEIELQNLDFADLVYISDEDLAAHGITEGEKKKVIMLFVGPSGSGKTTIAKWMSNCFGMKVLDSYTTRAPRYEGEKGHIFVTDEEFDKLTDLVAYTEFDGHRYCATAEQVEENDIYVIDPAGVEYFKEKYHGSKDVKIVYFDAGSKRELKKRMLERGDKIEDVERRIKHDQKAFKDVVSDTTLRTWRGLYLSILVLHYNYVMWTNGHMSNKVILGQKTATAEIARRAKENEDFGLFIKLCFFRHTIGDWGDMCESDKEMNNDACSGMNYGEGRVMSVYNVPEDIASCPGERIWIITEADRSCTTVLFPDEY